MKNVSKTDFSVIERGGEKRVLACLPRKAPIGKLAFAPLLADNIEIMPRSEWKFMSTEEFKAFVDNEPYEAPTDQDGLGSCGGNSATMLLEWCRHEQGEPHVRLASGRLYHYSGGGHDSGSMLSDNLQFAMQVGIPTLKDRTQELDYRSSWTAEEKAEGLKYRLLGAVDCPSFDSLATAVQRGFGVQHGIDCGRRYDVDSTGVWIQEMSGSGGGHAQFTPCKCLVYDKAHGWGLGVCGSWGVRFGYKGWYVVPESYFSHTNFNDGWGARYVVTPSDSPAPVLV